MLVTSPTQNLAFGYPGEYSTLTQSGANKFPNPFFDIASEYLPRDLRQIFEFCEYIYLTFGTYRSAARKVVRYFLTDLVLDGESDKEREEYLDYLNNELHLMSILAEIGDDYMCFHRDTKVVTKDGIFKISELTGKTVEVLSQGGIYRKAEFKSFGYQKLMEVEFSDGRTVLATPEHQWIAINCSNKEVKVPTTKLRPGYTIERTVAPRPEKNAEFEEGVRHGFVFGDGVKTSKNRTCAIFCGKKDEAVMAYFKGYGCVPRHDTKHDLWRIGGLPGHYKTLPDNRFSASYWYGFVVGFLAADGTVDTYGCAMLTQISKKTLEVIEEQLPRIGMCAGPIRAQRRITDLRKYGNHNENAVYDSTLYFMTLLKRFMIVEDLLLPSHIDKFNACKRNTAYGKYIGIKSVKETGIIDEVFCCVEMETHTMVIENGILSCQCYGNCFVSIYFPFDRFLICPKCKTEYHVDTIKYKFELGRKRFLAKCVNQTCGYEGEFGRDDRRSLDRSRLFIKRWNPKLIRIRRHHISGEMEYYMEFEPIYLQKITDGVPFYLNRTPWEVIECIADTHKSETPLFKFDKGSIYHLHEMTLAGLPIRGWGVPPIIPNFKLAYYIQILRRYDEAIAFDFIVPHRIIYPDNNSTGPAGMDALQATSMALFNSFMQAMIKNHRKDPTDLQAAPFKIGYQMIGGEGKALAPKENIALALDELLNAVGFPADLYKGSLQLQTAPVALRLFEKTWGTLVDGNNDLINWIITRISKHFNWGEITGSLRPVTLADDIERKALALQAAAGQDISKATAYRPLGIDYMEEQRKVIDEQQKIQELQQEAQEEQQAMAMQQGQGGGQGGPGGGAEAAAGVGATPGDVYERGKQIAYQLVTQTPESLRRGELTKIKQSNPTLHAIVLQEMDVLRRDMARQGQAMMMQQAQQGGGQKMAAAMEDAKSLPSPLRLELQIMSAICDYNRKDLRKIAMDIKRNVTGADKAFHFIYQHLRGII